jgi:hypothetical protein
MAPTTTIRKTKNFGLELDPSFNGTVEGVTFVKGWATTTDPAAIDFFHDSPGFMVEGGREPGTRAGVGARIRDAAVDPRPGDFGVPANIGEADPHGPDVVWPGIR